MEEKEETQRNRGREVREGRREGGVHGGMRRREEGKGEMEGGREWWDGGRKGMVGWGEEASEGGGHISNIVY